MLESIPSALPLKLRHDCRFQPLELAQENIVMDKCWSGMTFLGLIDTQRKAKFVKRYANLYPQILNAVNEFCREVKEELYPGDEHSYNMPEPDSFSERVEELYGSHSTHPSDEGSSHEKQDLREKLSVLFLLWVFFMKDISVLCAKLARWQTLLLSASL